MAVANCLQWQSISFVSFSHDWLFRWLQGNKSAILNCAGLERVAGTFVPLPHGEAPDPHEFLGSVPAIEQVQIQGSLVARIGATGPSNGALDTAVFALQ